MHDTNRLGALPSDRAAGLRPQSATPSSLSSIPSAEPETRAEFCKSVADRTIYKPSTANYTRVWQAAGIAFDSLSPLILGLEREAARLRYDLSLLTLDHAHCEACCAPLLIDDDEEVGCDENGCFACHAAFRDDPRASGDCFAYRSLDRTVGDAVRASGIEAATAGETQSGSTEGDSPTGGAGDAQPIHGDS